MRPAERLSRALRRTDTRAVLAIAGALVLVLALQASWLYAFAAMEELEQADHWMEQTRELVHSLDPAQTSDESLLEAAYTTLPGGRRAARLFAADGGLRFAQGEWPAERRQLPARADDGPGRHLDSFLLLHPRGFLVDRIDLADGRRLELAMPLKRFAGETREIGMFLLGIVLLSTLAALGTAIFATRRAFAPLRDGTALLAGVDAGHLGARLPTRATGDPVDRHAETLNRVLARIEDAFARLRGFSSDVAHELRTPLNRMRNVADVALARGSAQEQGLALERIQDSIEELARMVDALLLIAEVDDRRVPLKHEPVNLDAWLRLTVEAWAPAFEERGATLTLHAAAGTVEADRALLDRVLSNLLDNALRHGAAGGRVALAGRREPDAVVITLDDAGPGVPEAERERVFERFVRLDRSRRGSGGGLGLALARGVARLLGGELALEASPFGGARFVWRLPADREPGLPRA
jgi:signal transduction histidine kinase